MAKGRNPERQYTGPPGYWGFSVGLTTPPSKSTTVTETQVKQMKGIDGCNGDEEA